MKIDRRTFGMLLAAGMLAPCCRAEAEEPAPAGYAAEDGCYTVFYRSDRVAGDLSHEIYYSDRLFDGSAFVYNHALALATLGMAAAAFSSWASDAFYDRDGNVGREDNLVAAWEALGYGGAKFYDYDITLNDPSDRLGFSIARKTLERDGRRETILALMARGAGYGCEWSSNLHTGSGEIHAGFQAAAERVFARLQAYLSEVRAREELGELRLWMGGYSRGGAVATLIAARVAQEMPEIPRDKTFVYTFAAPAAITAAADPIWKLEDRAADGTEEENLWQRSNVHNIVSSSDFIPCLMPKKWGYLRNGTDRFLPAVSNAEEAAQLTALMDAAEEGALHLDFAKFSTAEENQALLETLEVMFGSQENYVQVYQNALMDMVQCGLTRSEEEIREGVLLSDEQIAARVCSMKNLQGFPEETALKNTRIAASLSRPVLESFGKDIPLQLQQAVIPLLATGLCHKLEPSVAQDLTRGVLSLIRSYSQLGGVMGVGYGHFPESYFALMEYYAPEEHGKEPYTRS